MKESVCMYRQSRSLKFVYKEESGEEEDEEWDD